MAELTERQLERHRLQLRKHLRRNYICHGIEGGLFGGAMAFVAGDIGPVMIKTLGGAPWLITLMPILMPIGWQLPPLLMAHRLEKLDWVHPLLLLTGALQRLPFLLAGLILVLGPLGHWSLLAAVVAAPFLSGLAGGLSQPAWQELVAKTLPEQRRSGVMALRNLISTAIGAGAGLAARELLEMYQGRITIGYGVLHLLTFAFLAASYLVFAMIRETNLPARPSRDTPTLWSNLRALPGLIANRPQYRRYLLDRLLAGGGFIMAAWRGIHVTSVLGMGDAYVGNLVIVGVAGGFVGNFLAGPMGDRFGGKAALLIGRALMVVVAIWMPLAQTQWEFLALFAAIGLAKTFAMVGQQTLTLEIVPLVKRATYLGLIAAVGLVGSIAGSQISRLTWQLTGGSFHWVSWLTLACSIGSVILLLRIDEPRGRDDAEALQA